MEIKPGMLVRIKRASIGTPSGSLGFVEGISYVPEIEGLGSLFSVRVYRVPNPELIRRYYAYDLEFYN